MVNPALRIAVIRPGGQGSHGKTGRQHADDTHTQTKRRRLRMTSPINAVDALSL